MDATELTKQGIAAAQAGKQDQARRLLMAAVEADERQEQAWLWLGSVVEGREDQIVALENVLTLNPANVLAERKLGQLRAQMAFAGPDAPPIEQRKPLLGPSPYVASDMVTRAATTAERTTQGAAALADSGQAGYQQAVAEQMTEAGPIRMAVRAEGEQRPLGIRGNQVVASPPAGVELSEPLRDEQLECPYCSVQTKLRDQTCPGCAGELWFSYRARRERSQSLWGLSILWLAQCSRIGTQYAIWVTTSYLTTELNKRVAPLTDGVLLGGPTPDQFKLYLVGGSYFVLIGFLLINVVGSFLRVRSFYFVNVVACVLMVVEGVFSLAVGVTGNWVWAVVGGLLAAVQYWLLTQCDDDFFLKHERIVAPPDDRKGRSALDYHNEAIRFMQAGYTAMAARAWRKAAAMQPSNQQYHLSLASAYLKLRQYGRIEGEVGEVLRREPDNLRGLNLLALALSNLGRFDEAGKLLARASQLKPGDATTAENVKNLTLLRQQAGVVQEGGQA